jgi:UDP-glucose:(heptosyl)LPS alpha-1,3-glucosyltransferase
MKILISRKDLRNTASGVPNIVLQELNLFRGIGFVPYVIAEAINVSMIKEFQGIPIKTLRWPISGYFRRKIYQMQVDRWIKKHSPELVIGHGDILNQDILFIHNCVHLANELIEGKPLPTNHEVGRIHKEIITQGSYKILVCNSELMRDDLVNRFKLPSDKTIVIYPEVKLDKLRTDSSEKMKMEWRDKFHIPQDAFVIGLVTSGNFKKRNLEMLIEAFKEIKKIHPEAHLFVGSGNVEQKYKEMISDSVTFAPVIIDVKAYYYLLDIFVLPAHIEEFGISVLEAMFCGKPVVLTKTVGASEILEGKSRDLILKKINVNELVSKIDLLFNKDFYFEIMKINIQTAIKYNTNSQNTKLLEAIKDYQILKTI